MLKSRETLNQALSLMTVAFNEISLGLAVGWLAPTLVILQDPKGEFKATLEESSWLACLEFAAQIPGAVLTAFALDIFGRKTLLTFVTLIFFLMWVINASTKSMLTLCVVRFMFGFAAGINDGTNSTYLTENCSPKIRATFGAVCITFYYMGLVDSYTIATYCSYLTTSIINGTITFLAILSTLWMTEPVQYLLMKGKFEQAEKNYAWLRGQSIENEAIRSEFERIKQNAQSEKQKKASLKEIVTSRANYKSLLIIIPLSTLVGCTGYFPVMSYATIAFSASDILTPNQFTILFGIVQFVVAAPTSFFIGGFKRRSTILFCFSIIATCHGITAALYYANSHITQITHFPWLIFFSITLYASIYVALYPVFFIIRTELFPLSVKAVGGCMTVIAFSSTSFLTTKIFPHLSESFGIEVNFIIFFIFSVIVLIFVYFFLPETKDKTLLEIQDMLEG